MVFGNPNCHPTAQNCSAAACCTYNGMCPEDWTVPDTCYYPYYWYNDRITTEIAIGIGLTVFAFVAITIAVGVIQWFYKHKKSYEALKEKRSETSSVQKQNIEGNQNKKENDQLKQEGQEGQEKQQVEQKEEESVEIEIEKEKKEKQRVINQTQNEFLPEDIVYIDYQ